jgi:acetyl-CoA acetyltransferase
VIPPPILLLINQNKTKQQAAKFGVSRREQDEFAALSHQRAAKAHKEGIYKVSCTTYKCALRPAGGVVWLS